MNDFRPIPPLTAVQAIERAGLGDGARVLVDFAAGGMVKGYARLTETVGAAGRTEVRDRRVPRELWRRISDAGLCGEIVSASKISIPADAADPAVELTGIRIDEVSLRAEIDRHAAPPSLPQMERPVSAPARAPKKVSVARQKAKPTPSPANPVADMSTKPDPAMFATVKEAMAMLRLGRTKVNDMMADGTLVRVKFGRATRVTKESICALPLR